MSRHVTYHEHILPYSNQNQPFQWKYHSNHHVTSVIKPEPEPELESVNNPNTKASDPEIYEPEILSNLEIDNHNQPPAHNCWNKGCFTISDS